MIFVLIHGEVFQSENSDTYIKYKDSFPFEKLGNKYINYINEIPNDNISYSFSYIAIKIEMLEDFLDIYENYINSPEINLINIENIKNNLQLFKNKINN
jgi:hypothetical protein